MRCLLLTIVGMGLWGLLALANGTADKRTDAEFDQNQQEPIKKGNPESPGTWLKHKEFRSRGKRDAASQLPFNSDSALPYTAYYTGQCFMCPPGPRGQPGVDGRDGRDGRDQAIDCPPGTPAVTPTSGGKTYVRWGRTDCPEGSQRVYEGVMGGKRYTEKGSGTNYLCLHNSPVFDRPEAGRSGGAALIYGVEAEPYFSHEIPTLSGESEIPCAVCMAVGKQDILMIPGVNNCPTDQGWSEEYHGYISSMHHNYHATEFICLDHLAEGIPGTSHDNDPSLLYTAEAACSSSGGGIPCPPYVDGYEVTCAVCSI